MQDSAINLFLANALSSLADERTPEELWKLLDQVEELLPVRNTCPDFPYLLVPATIAPRNDGNSYCPHIVFRLAC